MPTVILRVELTPRRKGQDGKVFGREEAVSRPEAICLYTEKAAYLAWDEKKKGTLEPGKFADRIVLDKDPLAVSAEELLDIKVDLTIIAGRIVHARDRSLD